jgi:hypothetical protein
MKYDLLVTALLIGVVGLAHAENRKYVEQGDSIYFCSTPEAAAGLAKVYNKDDDFDIRNYVDSTSQCGRLPPNAEAKFYILTDTERGGLVKVEIVEPSMNGEHFVWIDSQQSYNHISYYNSTLKDTPLAVRFSKEFFGCPTLQGAIEHARLTRLATQVGGMYLGSYSDTGNSDKKADFTCTIIRPGERADMYIKNSKNGFVPVQMYDKTRTTLWIPGK